MSVDGRNHFPCLCITAPCHVLLRCRFSTGLEGAYYTRANTASARRVVSSKVSDAVLKTAYSDGSRVELFFCDLEQTFTEVLDIFCNYLGLDLGVVHKSTQVLIDQDLELTKLTMNRLH